MNTIMGSLINNQELKNTSHPTTENTKKSNIQLSNIQTPPIPGGISQSISDSLNLSSQSKARGSISEALSRVAQMQSGLSEAITPKIELSNEENTKNNGGISNLASLASSLMQSNSIIQPSYPSLVSALTPNIPTQGNEAENAGNQKNEQSGSPSSMPSFLSQLSGASANHELVMQSMIMQSRLQNQQMETEAKFRAYEAQEAKENDPALFKPGITVVGGDEYKAKMEAKLAELKATPEGRELFEQIEKSGYPVRIKAPSEFEDGPSSRPDNPDNIYANSNGTPNKGCGATIRFDPSFTSELWKTDNSAPVLFHELIHAYNYATGTMQKGGQTVYDAKGNEDTVTFAELQAVGLKFNAPEITYPDGVKRIGNPPEFTENAMRKRLGMELRDRYHEDEVTKYTMEEYNPK